MYGSTPLEDIINYNQVVRNLTEWAATNQYQCVDQLSITDGVGGIASSCVGSAGTGSAAASTVGLVNVRQKFIQGIDNTGTNGFGSVPNADKNGTGVTPNACTRKYQVNLALGLLTQDKLIPVKFMASQLAIEITLETPESCIFVQAAGSGATPTYLVSNINLIPEILEFDASYDAMFLRGLQEGGVPIKFSSWHTFQFSTGAATQVNLQVQERSRSVKSLFCVQTTTPATLTTDSHATLNSSATSTFMSQYQWRIGGRYFPASPVQGGLGGSATVSNCGAEAFIELQKALNIVGDYKLSTSVNALRWAQPVTTLASLTADYVYNTQYYTSTGVLFETSAVVAPLSGTIGSACYCAAVDLETSNGVEISGLNAEEQSDISFIGQWTGAQASGYTLTVFTYYDAMLILRENNVLELIQ